MSERELMAWDDLLSSGFPPTVEAAHWNAIVAADKELKAIRREVEARRKFCEIVHEDGYSSQKTADAYKAMIGEISDAQ